MSKPEELRRLADVAAQVLRDMQAQDVLLEWHTLLDDALREYADSLERKPPKLTEVEIEALAHRRAWRYKHSSDPSHSHTYTFNGHTLQDFAAAICELRDKQWRGEV